MTLLIVSGGIRMSVYGDYLREILHAEGFRPRSMEPVASELPSGAMALVLPPALLDVPSCKALHALVSDGADLVVLRPSVLLRRALGLSTSNTTLRDGYLRGMPDSDASFLEAEPLQLPVISDHYPADLLPLGTRVIAEQLPSRTSEEGSPAVFRLSVGKGTVTVFAYDAAEAVALLRQGDPRQVWSRSLGGNDPYRPTDLLAGFVDPEAWHRPQADLHAALLSTTVSLTGARPARIWHFPTADVGTLVVQDSDDDWSTREQFDALVESVEDAGAHVTFYLMAGSRPTVLDAERVLQLRSRGHSFGIHHNAFDEAFDGEEQALVVEKVLAEDLAWFRRTFGFDDILVNRNHCLMWQGYAEMAKLQAGHGLVMDLNYENSPEAWLKFMAGSGRPMRFVDVDGSIVNVFQQATHVFDDSLVESRLTENPASEVDRFREFLKLNRDRYFIPTVLQSHPVSFATYSKDFFVGCWAAASAEGIPIWSSEEWARWVLRRDEAAVQEFDCGTTVIYEIVGDPDSTLSIAVPDQAFGSASPAEKGVRRVVFGVPHTVFDVHLGLDGTGVLRLEKDDQ